MDTGWGRFVQPRPAPACGEGKSLCLPPPSKVRVATADDARAYPPYNRSSGGPTFKDQTGGGSASFWRRRIRLLDMPGIVGNRAQVDSGASSSRASIARFARSIVIPRRASMSMASMALGAPQPFDRRRTNVAGEPDWTRSMGRIGPSRSSRSFNDKLVVVHPLHQGLCDHHQVRSTDRVGTGILNMRAGRYQNAGCFDGLASEHQLANRRLDQEPHHRVVCHVGQ